MPQTDTYTGLQLQSNNYGYILEGGLRQSYGGILKISLNNNGTVSEKIRVDTSGNVGIGTTGPTAKLQVSGGDAAVTTQGNGAILRATDGSACYRVTVNNAGALSTASVICPL